MLRGDCESRYRAMATEYHIHGRELDAGMAARGPHDIVHTAGVTQPDLSCAILGYRCRDRTLVWACVWGGGWARREKSGRVQEGELKLLRVGMANSAHCTILTFIIIEP